MVSQAPVQRTGRDALLDPSSSMKFIDRALGLDDEESEVLKFFVDSIS